MPDNVFHAFRELWKRVGPGEACALKAALIAAIAALAFTLLLPVNADAAKQAKRAVDGDTVVIRSETIRVLNIDTPEIGQAKCAREKAKGLAAKGRMQELVNSGRVSIKLGDKGRAVDRYGRTLARLSIKGQDLGDILIREGHARRWTGKRQPWCN